MSQTVKDVVFVDGARTPFARAGSLYAETRADDLVVKVIQELLRRNPSTKLNCSSGWLID